MSALVRSTTIREENEHDKDPYRLNFEELRNQHVKETTTKLPFVKSTFIHYAASPTPMNIDGQLYSKDELVITMELVQAPVIGHDQKPMRYTSLEDPVVAKKRAKEKDRIKS
jgi:hypothetical protein